MKLSESDKRKIEVHLHTYLVSLSDFSFVNKEYERKLRAELKDLMFKVQNCL